MVSWQRTYSLGPTEMYTCYRSKNLVCISYEWLLQTSNFTSDVLDENDKILYLLNYWANSRHKSLWIKKLVLESSMAFGFLPRTWTFLLTIVIKTQIMLFNLNTKHTKILRKQAGAVPSSGSVGLSWLTPECVLKWTVEYNLAFFMHPI